MRLLVADPDPVCRAQIAAVAEALGFECEGVSDGDAAWAAYLRRDAEVVLAAPELTGLTVWELLTWVREEGGERTSFLVLCDPEEGDRRETAIELGADDYLVKPLSDEELALRLRVVMRIHALRERLSAQALELERLRARLSVDASTDADTGLAAPARLPDALAEMGERVRRYGQSYALAVLAVDRLGDCELAFGPGGSRRALALVAAAVRGQLRASDGAWLRPDGRLLLALPEQDLRGALVALERIARAVRALEAPRSLRPGDRLTVSAGVARLQRLDDLTPEAAMARADQALASAIAMGGDRTCMRESSRFALGINLAG